MTTTREAWLEKLAKAWTAWIYGGTGQVVAPEDAPSAIQYLAGELADDPEVAIVRPVGELEGDSPTGSVITSTPEEQ